ncbi:MAG: GNAT family N-acetyltransferase [Oscillospiraceae bacterium]|nr:GNAT family N-acetyltransferase [Oscillospiraceae bacterium]
MRFANFHPIETERLYLRQLRLEDVYEYYERLFGDGDVSRYMLFDPHQDIGESLESLQRKLERYEEGPYYCWGVTTKEEDSLIGLIELLRFDEAAESCSFVYMLGCDYWGQGYGTEMLQAVIRFAFEELGIERIVADHMTKNPASGAVMRKAGMTRIDTEEGKYEKLGIRYDADVYEICNAHKNELTVNKYQKLAMATLNPALSKKDVLINGVMGLCGESGEAIDIVKKWLAQGHELDKARLAKELGDIAWYLAETAYALELSLEDIFQANIDKLKKRYPEGFDFERSIFRTE